MFRHADEIDDDRGQSERMAERDQLRRAFGGHDAGEPCHREHIALCDVAQTDAFERFAAHHDAGGGGRHSISLRLVGDVDHSCSALFIEVGKARLCRRQAQQATGCCADIGLTHQGLADQKAACARSGEAVEILGPSDAAFRDDETVGRDFGCQPLGRGEIAPQRLQVAVVDADHPHSEPQGAIELGLVMDFGQNFETELGRRCRELGRHRVRQRRHDQQHAIGADMAAFEDLVRVENEILAQHRQFDRPVCCAQILVAALEVGRVGQHREAARPARRIGSCQGRRVEIAADQPRARRGLFDLDDQAVASLGEVPFQRLCKATRRRRLGEPGE